MINDIPKNIIYMQWLSKKFKKEIQFNFKLYDLTSLDKDQNPPTIEKISIKSKFYGITFYEDRNQYLNGLRVKSIKVLGF